MRHTFLNTLTKQMLEHYAHDIINSDGMQYEKQNIQHGYISCYDHSVSVACLSIRLALFFRINKRIKSLIRGALLHDYFLYDFRAPEAFRRLHGFTHAKLALINAERDFNLDNVQRDIIAKHMFPVNLTPPKYIESVIVTIADKICAVRELFASISFSAGTIYAKHQADLNALAGSTTAIQLHPIKR